MKLRQKWDLSIRIDKDYRDFFVIEFRNFWKFMNYNPRKISCHKERLNHIRHRNIEYGSVIFNFF